MQLIPILACGGFLLNVACAQRGLPDDFTPATIDPQVAASKADLIVLAYPVDQKDIRHFTTADEPQHRGMQVREVETNLRVIHVFKGPGGTSNVRFVHYQEDAAVLMGPPQGPSGGIGARGIFFLRARPGRGLRSFVDVYRPDIPTPWVRDSIVLQACGSPAACIAELLMSVSPTENEQSFAASLRLNMAIVRELVGYVRTLNLLRQLLRAEQATAIQPQACTVMSEWFALELTKSCYALLSPTEAGKAYDDRLRLNQKALRQKGISWLEERVHPNDDKEFLAYLESLSASADEFTVALAARWAAILRENGADIGSRSNP